MNDDVSKLTDEAWDAIDGMSQFYITQLVTARQLLSEGAMLAVSLGGQGALAAWPIKVARFLVLGDRERDRLKAIMHEHVPAELLEEPPKGGA
jgi:hypothetical protein